MQLVRTVTGRYERTWRRKLLEMVLAVRLTRHIGRDRLPTLYLWVAYYGWRMNGFKQACFTITLCPSYGKRVRIGNAYSATKVSGTTQLKPRAKTKHSAAYSTSAVVAEFNGESSSTEPDVQQ